MCMLLSHFILVQLVWPHRWQPTRLPCPRGSPGKNTGVGCHFLLQCMKVKSESEVTQLYPTLSNPMDCSLPGSSIHGIFQARILEWGTIAFSSLCLYTSTFYGFLFMWTPNQMLSLKIFWSWKFSICFYGLKSFLNMNTICY